MARAGIGQRVAGTVRKTRRSLRHSGLLRTAQRVVQRTVPPALLDFNALVLVEHDLTEWKDDLPDAAWRHRWGGQQDGGLLRRAGMPDSDLQKYTRHGGRAVLTIEDGAVIAYHWIVPSCWPLFGWLNLRLRPGEVYGAQAFVEPGFRGRRLYGEQCKFSFSQLANQGVHRFVTFIERLNRISLRAQTTHPRRMIGRIAYIRILGLVVYWTGAEWGAGFWSQKRPREMWIDAFRRPDP